MSAHGWLLLGLGSAFCFLGLAWSTTLMQMKDAANERAPSGEQIPLFAEKPWATNHLPDKVIAVYRKWYPSGYLVRRAQLLDAPLKLCFLALVWQIGFPPSLVAAAAVALALNWWWLYRRVGTA